MKKAILFCMAVVLLASSLALFSCGGDDGSSTNPFIGTWAGTAIKNGITGSATFKITSSAWNFECAALKIKESGTITIIDANRVNRAELQQRNVTIGYATVTGDKLEVGINYGTYSGTTGSLFKKK